MRTYVNKNRFSVAALIAYVFVVVHIQFYISCRGQTSPAYILSRILVLMVLIGISLYILAGVRRFNIPVKASVKSVDKIDQVDRKTSIG